jgi:AGZA family xanthine/uracil permease-like MFS transporter
MKDFFELKKRETTVKREFVGGLTTFLTMAYIVFVSPDIMSQTGMDKGALITATCLASALGTLIVALWVNAPMAMAPGMGLIAFFTYSLVLPNDNVTWQMGLGVVFISGIFFLLLTISKLRQKIIDAIPVSLRLAVGAGIGFFITFIGMKNMGLIVAHPETLVTLGEFTRPVVLGLIGLIIILMLEVKKVRGALLIGIVATYMLGLIFGEVSLNGSPVSLPPSIAPIAFKLDILGALQLSFVGAIFSFMFVDLFDSVGTIVACSYQADMVNEDGSIAKIDKMLEADAGASLAGALLGTSTTTTYVESAAGIADGARTGLSSLFIALFFLGSLFFAPLIGSVPSFATSPALIVVGACMFGLVKEIDISKFEVAAPAFLTIIMMPATYSISNGISAGFLAHIIMAVAVGKIRTINPILWIIGGLSLLNLIFGG